MPLRGLRYNEELAAIRVRPAVCHGKVPRVDRQRLHVIRICVSLPLKLRDLRIREPERARIYFIGKIISGPALSIVGGVVVLGIWVASLDHKNGNNAMEFCTVVKPLFGKFYKILNRLGSCFAVEFERDSAL